MMGSLEHFSGLAGGWLTAGIWQGLLFAVAAALVLRLFPGTTASLRFFLWSMVFTLAAYLPFFEGASSVRSGRSFIHLDTRWSIGVGALWMTLSLLRGCELVLCAGRLRFLHRRAIPVPCDRVPAALLKQSGRSVRLCTSTEIDRPTVIGFFQPRILIPGWMFEQLSDSELQQVVLHEVEHLRRGDDWLNLLQKLSLALLPLNPVLLWVEGRLCVEREIACDDGVLRHTLAPRAYASCLTRMAERALERRTLALALGALGAFAVRERRPELARRVHRILRRDPVLPQAQVRLLTGFVLLGLLAAATGLARCPQLVSFVSPAQTQATTAVAGGDHAALAELRQWREPDQGAFAESLGVVPALHRASWNYDEHMNRPKPRRHVVAAAGHHVRSASVQREEGRPTPLQRGSLPLASPKRREVSAHPYILSLSWSSAPLKMIDPEVPLASSDNDGVFGVERLVVLPYVIVSSANGWEILQL